jgi:hypothetical protein
MVDAVADHGHVSRIDGYRGLAKISTLALLLRQSFWCCAARGRTLQP